MSATLKYNSIQVQAIGRTVTVPNDDIARLMYYLSCVDTVIRHDQTDRLSDYEHYYRLTQAEEDLLLKLVVIFNPKIFINAGIFIVDQNLLPYNMDNEFYQITDQRIGIHVNQEIIIGGKSVKVLKIMACNSAWLNRNYINPIENIANRAKSYKALPAPSYSSNNYNYNYSNYNNNSNNCCNKKCICCCIIIIILLYAIPSLMK